MGVAKQISDMMAGHRWATRIPAVGKAGKNYIDLSTSSSSRRPSDDVCRAFVNSVRNEPAGAHRYMTNAGYLETRRAVSEYLKKSAGIEVPPELIVMTYGASGGINIMLKALLDPDEEAIIVSPHPFEYPIFIWNHGGKAVTVGANEDFSINPGRTAAAADVKTKAVLMSCPNDPTGMVYSEDSIRETAGLLADRQKEFDNTIYIIWDQRYRRITHDGADPVNIFELYDNSIITGSFSKDLGIGGERAGYVAVNPRCPHRDNVFAAAAMVIRTLGFVNCPALVQRAVANMEFGENDVPSYTAQRNLLCDALRKSGYEFQEPRAGYFVFVKSPTGDDGFVEKLKDEGILVAPGSAFGVPGYFRISFCAGEDGLRKALGIFERLGPGGSG